MKTTLITVFAFMCLSTLSFAQTNTANEVKLPDPVVKAPPAKAAEKPTYQPDFSKQVTINIQCTIPVGYLGGYVYVLQSGGPNAISQSQRLHANEATDLMNAYNVVTEMASDSVNAGFQREYLKFINADKARFTADTTAKYHPATKTKH